MMNGLSSPSPSTGGDPKFSSSSNNAAAAAASKTKNSTPTMIRAKNTSRRISVWMQQTWRERSIPSADFGNSTRATTASQAMRSNASLVSVASPGRIASSLGTPVSKRVATPQAKNNHVFGSPANNNNSILNPEETLVANVDEAFGAWTSLYKFQDHFPELDAPEEEDDIVDRSVDWVLDGHSWEEECQKSQELLKMMYPEPSANMFADLLATMSGRAEGADKVENKDNSSANQSSNGVDEESMLLLKFGSAMGQQEYQFASFETADFSNLATEGFEESNKDHDPGSTEIGKDQMEAHDTADETKDSPKDNRLSHSKTCTQREPVAVSHAIGNGEASDTTSSIPGAAKPALSALSVAVCENTNAATTTSEDTIPVVAAASSDDDDNFEAFWQSAIEAPTPETGTFPSIGSRSTYALSPLVDDGLFSPPNGVKSSSDIVLDCIYSQEENDDSNDDDGDDDVNRKSDDKARINQNDVKEEFAPEDYNRCESDTGELQDGSRTPEVQNQDTSQVQDGSSKFMDNGDENDCVGIPTESIIMTQETGSSAQQNALIDESVEEDREESMDQVNVNVSFETAFTPLPGSITAGKDVSSSPTTLHTGVTPLKKNGRCSTPITPLQNGSPTSAFSPDNDEFETPLSHRLFHSQQEEKTILDKPHGSPTGTSMSASAAQAAEAAAMMQQFTPVTRNFRYWEPNEASSPETPEQRRSRTLMIRPTNKHPTATPDRRFRLEDMNNVMNGISDDASDINEEERYVTKTDSRDEEIDTQAEEESLLDESIQSSSIPSVVQLFTKSVDTERRSKIVVPNTVRATRNQGVSLGGGAFETMPSTNTGLTMPSFYFGRNENNHQKRRPSSEIVSLSASEVASASASIMSMPMMKNSHRHGKMKNKQSSEQLDEPSINSSLASPEVKFLRRNKNAQSKRSIRRSSLSIHSRTSRTTDGFDDGIFDDRSQQHRHYGDPRCDFYHYYYGYDEDVPDSDDSSVELTDEESLSLGSLSTLPNEYWKHPELDHTLRELKKLEWDWLPYWQMEKLLDEVDHGSAYSTGNIPLLQDQITQKLSKLDSFYGKICKKVYRKIQPHSESLLSANQAAMDLHQNLQLSHMYLSRSQESIQLAKYGKIYSDDNEDKNNDTHQKYEGVGVHGALRLLELWDIQHSYHDLCRVEKVISEISDLEAAISRKIQCFDTYKENAVENFEILVNMVEVIETKLAADPANRLVCFESMRGRSNNWISEVLVRRLHDCLSDIAVEWCLATDSSESTIYVADGPAYSRIIEILLRINDCHTNSSGDHSTAPIGGTQPNPVMAICTSIQTSLLLEIQKAFGRALLDPTDSETDEKSEYEQELAALASNETYLDASRLTIWTHNLVTIRFEFEMKQGGKHRLPAIFHKLCLLLTNILCGLHRLIEWHSKKASDGISTSTKIAICDELRTRRASIWNACIQSIEECLQEYINHSGKRDLFSRKNGSHDDSGWRQDLEGLHDISMLSQQFLSLMPLFLADVSKEVINDGSRIDEKLYSCFKTHLRAFHVEAMNSLGTMFYREDWNVYSLEQLKGATASTKVDGDDDFARVIFEAISEQLQSQFEKHQTFCCRSQHNEFARSKLDSIDRILLLTGDKNPFEIYREQPKAEKSTSSLSHSWLSYEEFCSDKRISPIICILRTYIGRSGDDGTTSKMLLKSVFEGVFPWTARLLVLFDRLPALAKDTSKVMQAIVDLYVTTAFRLCAGNGRNERVLLGIDAIGDTATIHPNADNPRANRSTSPSIFEFGSRHKSSQYQSNRPAPVISSTAEAELCALVLEESNGLEQLQDFILASQKRLEGVAKTDLVDGWIRDPEIGEDTIEEEFAEQTARVLERRQAASCNNIFVAIGLFLATRSIPLSTSYSTISHYTNQMLDAIPLLTTLSNRISCMRAIRGRTILREVIMVGSVWEESKLHEQANEYVEEFCDFLALLWHSLYTGSGGRLPVGILQTLWENLVGGGYMVLLDGFSKVPYCSTEGRALMSMDLASYRSGTCPRSIAERLEDSDPSSSACPLPTDTKPYRTMAYVDTYIKIFYFPSKDALEWIRTNYRQYHQHHVISLVTNDRDAKKLTNQVAKCYNGNQQAETIRI